MKRILLLFALLSTVFASPIAAQGPLPLREAQALRKVDRAVLNSVTRDGRAGFWLVMGKQADLSGAASIKDWKQRGAYVVKQLQDAANKAQAGTRRSLVARKATFQSYWISNAIHVKAADHATLVAAASVADVARVVPEQHFAVPPVEAQPRAAYEIPGYGNWNVKVVKAPEAWATYRVRGEGIVVANIDTGVRFDHPALVRQYRGRLADGTFDHNYNWFDPSRVCPTPGVPCDNHDHGTHTMGTMVGDDGATEQIGIAPGARWIAAKGCEVTACSDSALLASGQWLLAPTDLGGRNPRSDLRPHIINNSWGTGPADLDTFYRDIVKAWIAAGIFPVFSNGNTGPGCQTANAPGNYAETYAVGSFDSYGMISGFSSRGSSPLDGVVKPNIAAPGEGVRSAVANGGYNYSDGTSMAAPHVAGAVALLWSASSPLVGNINATRAILDGSAVDVDDTFCGGTTARNNVWGEGKLDVLRALGRVTRDARGTLSGKITDAATGAGILGATIAATGPLPQQDNRMITAAADGTYNLSLPKGTYNVTVSAYGYSPQTMSNVAIAINTTTTRNAALTSLPRYTISGVVRDTVGTPLAGIEVGVSVPTIPVVRTRANGAFTIPNVPEGSYTVQALPTICNGSAGQQMTLTKSTSVSFRLSRRSDAYGYTCRTLPAQYVQGVTKLSIDGFYGESQLVALPFPFRFYGKVYRTAHVATNGFLNFLGPQAEDFNFSLPDLGEPNAAIYPYWDHFDVDADAGVYTAVTGTAPNRQFIVEWRNVTFVGERDKRVSFEAILHENGEVTTQYRDLDANSRELGDSATVGIDNEDGRIGFQYSFNQPVLLNQTAVRFTPPVANLLRNPGFELDSNYDYRPDAWTVNPSFQFDWFDEGGRFKNHTGQHLSEANATYSVAQTVPNIVAGARYSFTGWVNIPHTSDTFRFNLQVRWLDAAGASLGTRTIKSWNQPTFRWDEAAANNLVAPAGATKAQIVMVVGSLNGAIYVDDFIFGR